MNGQQQSPLVSVILPVYNGAGLVSLALESATAQTYRNLEIIVVDDGSTDDTWTILQGYAASDSRIRVFTQANAGVARARNRALAEARGELIAPLDADDLWLPEKIERQVARMLEASEDTGLVYCWWAWIDGVGAVLDRSPRWRIEGSVLKDLIFINFTGNASVPLFRRRCIEEADCYNEALRAAGAQGCEDWEIALRVAERHKVTVVPEVLVGYRRRPGTMSSACETMWRSQSLVMQGLRKRQPELAPALFRASANQFRMYLAGVSFWSGNRLSACRWALRAGLRLPLLVSPHVVKVLLWPRRNEAARQTMLPGAYLDTSRLPEPLIPYDRLWTSNLVGRAVHLLARGVSASIASAPRGIRHLLHACLLTKARLESRGARSQARTAGPRVLAAACWHFPIYSQTFVYRELLKLASEGFDVRFAYAGLTGRAQLPDDCSGLWRLKRRIYLSDATAGSDLRHYQRRMPARVAQIARQISHASGLPEDEVVAHRHFRQAFSFARYAEAWEPDYIHTYFFYEAALFGFVASSLLGIPRGVSCYADHMMNDYDLKLIAMHMRTCDIIVATSARIKGELEALAQDSISRAIVKPNGIDVSSFAFRKRLPSEPNYNFRVTAVNRIHPKKGVLQLVEAAAQLRHKCKRFVIEILGDHDAGDPESEIYYRDIKNYVTSHRLEAHVIFRGRQTAAQVKHALEETDIFVAPFVELPNGDKDGIPTALLEAMAAGCSVVSTDAGSILEVIRNQVEGLIVPQYDSGALASAIAQLLQDHALRARLAEASLERVREYFDTRHCEAVFHQKVRSAIAADRHATGTLAIL